MTPLEAAALCRFTKAVCPQQAIDEYTPDAWHPLLERLRFDDARVAVITVGQRQPFVAPAEIIAEVRRIRAARLTAFGPLPAPPAEVVDDSAAYTRYVRDMIRRIADGELTDAPAEVVTPGHAERVAELGHIGRAVPDA